MNTAEEIIEHLGLIAHPEGGFFKETYRSQGAISQKDLGANYTGERNFSTAIYFMLTADSFSAFHRVNQDEFWHFHQGSALELHMISPDGEHSRVLIGNNLAAGEVPQFVVPGGYWFAATVIDQPHFSLVSCTVSPGFDFDDFTLAKRAELIESFPQHHALIEQFTRV